MTQDELDTLQDFFDHAWEAFVVDGLPKSGCETACYYRHPWIKNHGCAIGCRDGFNELLDGKAASFALDMMAPVGSLGGFIEPTALGRALDDLQQLHDRDYISTGTRSDRACVMIQFADHYGLEVDA